MSAQQYVDCSPRPEDPELSNNGCEYGHYEECAIYLKNHPGVLLEEDYPYTGVSKKCSIDKKRKLLTEYSVEYVPLDTEYDAYLALKPAI